MLECRPLVKALFACRPSLMIYLSLSFILVQRCVKESQNVSQLCFVPCPVPPLTSLPCILRGTTIHRHQPAPLFLTSHLICINLWPLLASHPFNWSILWMGAFFFCVKFGGELFSAFRFSEWSK